MATVADRIRDVVRPPRPSTRSGRSRAYNPPVRRASKLFAREPDMDRLLAALMVGQSVRVAARVEGLAGVGKTELTLHLVDLVFRDRPFPWGIFG